MSDLAFSIESSARAGASPMSVRRVLALAWPVMVSMVSYSLMSAADAIFVGRLGTAPLAAIGLAVTTTWLFLAMPMGLMRGLRVAAAQATGAGRVKDAESLGWQSLWLAGGVGVLVAVASLVGVRVFLLLGATPQVAALAQAYFGIRALAAPIALVEMGLTSWFEGRGDTVTPMRANVASNILWIALDAVLVNGFGPVPALGIAGAAWAGVIALGVAAIWLLIAAWPTLRATRFWPDRRLLAESSRLGLPIGVQRTLDIVAWTVLTGVLAGISDAQLAAHVVAIRVLMTSFLPGMAIAEATAVLVGQSVGARRPDDAVMAWKSGVKAAMALMAAGGLTFILFPDLLLAPFHVAADVAPIARNLLAIAAAFQLLDAIATVTYFSLDGAGDTRFTLKASIVLSWGVKLPIGVLLARTAGLGAVGAWLGLTAELVLLLVILVGRWQSRRWYVATPASGQAVA